MIGYRISIGPCGPYEHTFKPGHPLFDLTDAWDLEIAAEEACADFRDNYDGWETWSRGDAELELFNPENGEVIFKCKVALCFEPSYEVWGVEK